MNDLNCPVCGKFFGTSCEAAQHCALEHLPWDNQKRPRGTARAEPGVVAPHDSARCWCGRLIVVRSLEWMAWCYPVHMEVTINLSEWHQHIMDMGGLEKHFKECAMRALVEAAT